MRAEAALGVISWANPPDPRTKDKPTQIESGHELANSGMHARLLE